MYIEGRIDSAYAKRLVRLNGSSDRDASVAPVHLINIRVIDETAFLVLMESLDYSHIGAKHSIRVKLIN